MASPSCNESRFAMRAVTDDAISIAALRNREDAKPIIVAGRGVVVADDGVHVDAHAAARRQVEAAADALAIATAAVAFAALGLVVGDRAAGDGDGADAGGCAAV